MKLTSFIYFNKSALNYVLMILMLMFLCKHNSVIAESLTYSPDQWPRHWNELINNTRQQQEYLSSDRSNGNSYIRQRPQRSPMWGMVPSAKKKSRRSLTPEYDTNYHMHNYYRQSNYGNYYGNNSPGFMGYGLPSPYGAPLINPYGGPVLAPGLAAPGIPFGTYPYGTPYPMMGGMPGMGYLW